MLETSRREERSMANMQEVRKSLEASLGNLNTARAQEVAKGMLDRDAAKEQVSKLTADLMEWSQRNRNRLTELVRSEVRDQLKQIGVVTEEDLNAIRKRVRNLERSSQGAKSTRARASTKSASTAKRTTKKTSTATTAKRAGSGTA
jgi:polyhydroxyalkanoate synthesis regulator phasin